MDDIDKLLIEGTQILYRGHRYDRLLAAARLGIRLVKPDVDVRPDCIFRRNALLQGGHDDADRFFELSSR